MISESAERIEVHLYPQAQDWDYSEREEGSLTRADTTETENTASGEPVRTALVLAFLTFVSQISYPRPSIPPSSSLRHYLPTSLYIPLSMSTSSPAETLSATTRTS